MLLSYGMLMYEPVNSCSTSKFEFWTFLIQELLSDEVVGTIDLDLKKDKFESYLLNNIANCRSCYGQIVQLMSFLLANHGSRSLHSHVIGNTIVWSPSHKLVSSKLYVKKPWEMKTNQFLESNRTGKWGGMKEIFKLCWFQSICKWAKDRVIAIGWFWMWRH